MARTKAKYKAADIKIAMQEVLMNGLSHVKSLNNELQKMSVVDPTQATEEQKSQLAALTYTLSLIVDLLHPAHKVGYEILNKCDHPMLDFCEGTQRESFKSNIVDPCFCTSCKENKNEK